ncbi:MAG: flagellar biosynthetic protein FliO [Planctomycetes bacterium]|nr:flagellar biosynthetic protein FliO [Planctomycetota bacterium]
MMLTAMVREISYSSPACSYRGRRSGLRPARTFVCFAAIVTAVAAAQDSVVVDGADGDSIFSSNHGAEIGSVATEVVVSGESDGLREDTSTPGADTTEPDDAAAVRQSELNQTRGTQPGSSTMRRRMGESLERSTDFAKDTVWYRSSIVSLAIVLIVIGGVYWLLRRWVPSIRASESGALRIVARTSVTPKQTVLLLQVGRRFVLAGASADRFDLLSEIRDPEEVAELLVRTHAGGQHAAGVFDKQLNKELGAYEVSLEDVPDKETEPTRTRSGSLQLAGLLDRLRSLHSK